MNENTNSIISLPSEAPLKDPWLVAVWPGMGGVAAIAGGHLVHSLNAKPVGMIPEREFFSIDRVDVKSGIARSGALPRSMFFSWRDPQSEHDLLIFIGEAQPATGGFSLCHRILDIALEHGVQRIVTFAAMGSSVHPTSEPRVFGAVTAPDMLESMGEAGVERLQEGQISGLNGSLLAAAADRGVPAMCLLGEMPVYAAGVPNPASSLAVLRSFERLFGRPLDLAALEGHAKAMEPQLLQLLTQIREQLGQAEAVDENDADDVDEMEQSSVDEPAREPRTKTEKLSPAARERIERLFAEAAEDRSRSGRLKAELDRLGVFEQYEDRFLDLFRKTG